MFVYKKATIKDIDVLTRTRILVLRAANNLSADTNMSEMQKQSYEYSLKSLKNNTHIAYLVFNENSIVGSGGISFFK